LQTFRYHLKTQFTFCVNDNLLSCILSNIADCGINLNGYEQTSFQKHDIKFNLIRLVPGTTEAQSKKDVLTVKEILRDSGVRFQQKTVIQLLELPSAVPGQVSMIFAALWCRVKVFAIYIGEDNTLFLDVSNNKRAVCILSQDNVEPCCKEH
jgi:hypothetical protein